MPQPLLYLGRTVGFLPYKIRPLALFIHFPLIFIRCEAVNYNRRSGTCQLFASLVNAADSQEKSEHVDFYRNVCRVKESAKTEEASGAANVPKVPQIQPPVNAAGAEGTTVGGVAILYTTNNTNNN
jgi:hypothetical protein